MELIRLLLWDDADMTGFFVVDAAIGAGALVGAVAGAAMPLPLVKGSKVGGGADDTDGMAKGSDSAGGASVADAAGGAAKGSWVAAAAAIGALLLLLLVPMSTANKSKAGAAEAGAGAGRRGGGAGAGALSCAGNRTGAERGACGMEGAGAGAAPPSA